MRRVSLPQCLALLCIVPLSSAPTSAQLAPPRPQPSGPVTAEREPPQEVLQALDEAVAELRVAEARGADAKEAFERAGARLRFVLERDPGNLRAKYYQGRMLLLSDREAQALSSLVEWTKSREGQNDPEAHAILGQVYYDMEFYKMATPTLEKAVELDPRAPKSYILLARCEAKLLHRKAAIDRIQQGIQLLGADVDADTYMLLTEILLLNQDVDLALRASRHAKELALAKVRAASGDVGALKKVDDCIDLALKIVHVKIKSDPSDVASCREMAQLLQEQAQVSALTGNLAALGWMQEALRRAGDRPAVDLLLDGARLLMRLGRVPQAVKWADRAAQLYPDNDDVQAFRATLPSPEVETPEETPPSVDSRSPQPR